MAVQMKKEPKKKGLLKRLIGGLDKSLEKKAKQKKCCCCCSDDTCSTK